MPDPKNKTIAGHVFQIRQPYEPGHTVTEIEAKVLNQVRAENVGNNVREAVKKLIEDGKTAEAESLVAEKDGAYEFTAAAAGGGSRSLDPVEREARKIAREAIKEALAAQGKKISDYDKETIENAVASTAEKEEVVKAAKKAVEQRTKTVSSAVEGLAL